MVLAGGPRRLLILDDAWTKEQLDAFLAAGNCVRLVTTRVPSLTDDAIKVRVGPMTDEQARALLLHGFPPLPPAVAAALLKKPAAGRCCCGWSTGSSPRRSCGLSPQPQRTCSAGCAAAGRCRSTS